MEFYRKILPLQRLIPDPEQLLKKVDDLQAEVDRLRSVELERLRSEERLKLMAELTRHLTLDLDELLEQCLQRLAHTLPQADIGVIYLYDPREKALVPKACFGYDRELLLQVRLQPGESMSGKVFLHGHSILTHTTEQIEKKAGPLSEQNHDLYTQATRGATIKSNICVPLQKSAKEFIGTLTLSSTQGIFSEQDLPLLEGIAGQIGHAAAHAQLFAALRESERKYRLLVEHLPVGISETTPDGTPIYFNQNSLAINGYNYEDIDHLNIADLYVDPRDRARLVDNLHQYGHHSYEHQLRQKDGHIVWVRGTTRAIRDEDGHITSYLGIQQDISEERIQQQRRQAVENVRREVWGMQRESDIERVLVSVRSNLTELGIPFKSCGINIVDGTSDPPSVRFHSMREDGEWVRTDGDKGTLTVLRFWRGGEPVYRKDLFRRTEPEPRPYSGAQPIGTRNDLRNIFAANHHSTQPRKKRIDGGSRQGRNGALGRGRRYGARPRRAPTRAQRLSRTLCQRWIACPARERAIRRSYPLVDHRRGNARYGWPRVGAVLSPTATRDPRTLYIWIHPLGTRGKRRYGTRVYFAQTVHGRTSHTQSAQHLRPANIGDSIWRKEQKNSRGEF